MDCNRNRLINLLGNGSKYSYLKLVLTLKRLDKRDLFRIVGIPIIRAANFESGMATMTTLYIGRTTARH